MGRKFRRTMYLPRFIRKHLKKREMVRFYRQFIRPGQLCFDIGANAGERTVYFLALGARVVAAEPQRQCFATLQKKFTNNPNVQLVQSALGSSSGEAELLLCDETTECATFSKKFTEHYATHNNLHWSNKEQVTVTTLDNLISKYGHPHFCKIDVEGFEGQVLSALSKAIPVVMFEFNRPLLGDTRWCIQQLQQLGDYRFNYIVYENMRLVLEEWQNAGTFLNKLEDHITPDVLTGEIVAAL